MVVRMQLIGREFGEAQVADSFSMRGTEELFNGAALMHVQQRFSDDIPYVAQVVHHSRPPPQHRKNQVHVGVAYGFQRGPGKGPRVVRGLDSILSDFFGPAAGQKRGQRHSGALRQALDFRYGSSTRFAQEFEHCGMPRANLVEITCQGMVWGR